ncbi:putative ribonuclease H-like domain-containing protein [Tanacetum coccineum]
MNLSLQDTQQTTSQNSQNIAFLCPLNNTRNININSSSTNEADNTTFGVCVAHTQSNPTSRDNLSDTVICAFLASQPNSPQLAQEDLEQIDPDDLEEMNLQWEMSMLTIRARRFIKRPGRKLDKSRNRGRENSIRTVTVETPTKNALVAQDGIKGYDWSYQDEEEHPTNFSLMAHTSSGSNSDDDSEVEIIPNVKDKTFSSSTEKIKFVKSGRETVEKINPQQKEYKEKEVINSGCSRHMTGNKFYLTEYEDYDGGFVSFGDGKGRISRKECFVLSFDFKLLDESQVLLRVPRKDNIYSVDLKSVVPTKGLTCLFAKATIDESNLWHKRLGDINFKNMNKLMRGNLVRGLPSKIFENENSCVACQKGKQHKASCKAKLVNSISKPLHMLHMDLFGPTNVKSLMKKSYCLVVTDDFSRLPTEKNTDLNKIHSKPSAPTNPLNLLSPKDLEENSRMKPNKKRFKCSFQIKMGRIIKPQEVRFERLLQQESRLYILTTLIVLILLVHLLVLLDHLLLMMSIIHPINDVEASNAFEDHLFERFSPFKNAFTLPDVPNVFSLDDT